MLLSYVFFSFFIPSFLPSISILHVGVKSDSPFILKFAAGSLAGALGSIVGNPFDVLKTRMMTAEGEFPKEPGGESVLLEFCSFFSTSLFIRFVVYAFTFLFSLFLSLSILLFLTLSLSL